LWSVGIFGSAPYARSSFISSVSLDCAARTNGVAPDSRNHCIVKIVRLKVLSLARKFGSAPWSSRILMNSR
jgi:hypothetical protein